MIVEELIEYLRQMPPDATVVSGKDVDGVWTVLSKPVLTKYEKMNICMIQEGVGK